MKFAHRVVALAVFAVSLSVVASAQCGLPSGIPIQILDNNGQPAGGALLTTTLAGTSTPAPSYTSSSCGTPNANPAVADSSGRVYLWIPTGTLYKVVAQTASLVTIWTLDNVSSSSGGGSSSTNYWTLTGSTIANNNASGAGNVTVGADFSAAGNITAAQTLQLSDSSTHFAILRAASIMPATTTWRLPTADGTVGQCLSTDGAGNLSFATCSGGGGGGNPVGIAGSIQTLGTSTTFFGDANLTYVSGTVTLGGTGSFQTTGINSGFNATGCTNPYCIQAALGGITGKSLIATDSHYWVEEAAPVVSAAGQAKIYSDSTLHWPQLSANASTFSPLAVTGAFGTFTTGHCVSTNISSGVLTLVDAGGACTTGGGGGTVASSSVGQVGVYTGATTITGGAGLTFNTVTGVLQISGGSGPGIQMTSASLSVTGILQLIGAISALAVTTDTTYNSISSIGGAAFCTSSTCTNGPALQVGSTAQWSVDKLGNETTASITDTGLAGSGTRCVQVGSTGIFTAFSSACGGSGGVSSITGTANNVLANGTSGIAEFGAVTVSLPSSLSISSVYQSTVLPGLGLGFQVANSLGTPFSVDGQGDISGNGSINMVGASSAGAPYKVNGVTIVDASRNATFNQGTFTSAATFNGGISIGSSTSSYIYVGNVGNFYNRTFSGTPSCSGVQNGWMGYDTGSNILWICNGGVAQAH